MPLSNRLRVAFTCFICLSIAFSFPCYAYSVLAHEAIIDSVWEAQIRPLILKRFPETSTEELHKAHAYAYGGAIVQDMGYYPHGSKLFSDLTHYVRSGDFIQALLRDSQNPDEYAFAIGAMAHYAADNNGHRLATNLAVPLLYPELRKKYGSVVTYEDNPTAHVKTEFGFDVLQVAKHRYAPDSYHDFIGFDVAQSLLERAFQETYGLPLSSILNDESRAIGSYRRDVSSLIPKATKVAWALKQDDIRKDLPGETRKKFLYNLSRASYEKEWGKDYQKPGPGDRFLAFLYKLVPKIGPLKILTFRTPTPEAEKMFEQSFNVTLDRYRVLLTELSNGNVSLPNDNLDVGEITARGEYRLDDEAGAQLLNKLAKMNFTGTSPELRVALLHYFEQPSDSTSMKIIQKDRVKLQNNLEKLKIAATLPADAGNKGDGADLH
jgi:hypothetical protein